MKGGPMARASRWLEAECSPTTSMQLTLDTVQQVAYRR